MGVCRSERARPRLAALALAGLLVGQTLVPCGVLLSSVRAAELRVANRTNANARSTKVPAWVNSGDARAAQPRPNLQLTQLAQAGKNGKDKIASEAECLDCEVDATPLDLSQVPTEKALRRAGSRDGALYPMRRGDAEELGIKLDRLLKRLNVEDGLRSQLTPKDPRFAALKRAQARYERARAINMLFGKAVKEWRGGSRSQATLLFREYMEKYPQTPWAGEAMLHLGYEAKNNGRLLDAEAMFREVLDKTSDEPNEQLRKKKRERNRRGIEVTDAERDADIDKALADTTSLEEAVSKLDSSQASDEDDESFVIHMKAKQQLADIDMAMGHFGDAADKLGDIMEEDTDWHRRVWARTQMQRASFLANNGATLMACGPQALGMTLVGFGKNKAAEKVRAAVAKDAHGFSMAELQTLAAKNGVAMRGFRSDVNHLSRLALPAILHYDFGRDSKLNGKNSGHFVTLQSVDVKGRNVRLFDPLSKKSTRLSYAQLERQWSGQGLTIDKASVVPVGTSLSRRAMQAAIGSSTTFASTRDIGDVGNNASVGVGDGMTAPAVTINQASLNLYIEHTVTSYQPLRGPSPAITISYNSDSDGQSDYLSVAGAGRKWVINYASVSYSNWPQANVNTTGSQIAVEMPDGSQDLYSWDQSKNRYVGEKGNFKWITSVFGGNGNSAGSSYSLIFPDGTSWEYRTDSYGSVLSSVRDSQGQSLQIDWNQFGGAGRTIKQIRDADGRITLFTYDVINGSRYAIKTIKDPFNRLTTFSYDNATGDLTGVTDSQGRHFNYTYDTQFSDVKTIELPAINNVAPVWTFNRWGEKFYTPDNKFQNSRMTVTDPNNGIQERYYQASSGKTFYVSPQNYLPAPNTFNSATTIQYISGVNGERVPRQINLPDGSFVAYDYEAQHGFVRRITNRQGQNTYFTYNQMGQVLTEKDPKGNLTTTTYAPNGIDPISVSRPNPNVADIYAPNAYIQVMGATYNRPNDRPHLPDTITDVGGTSKLTYTDWGAPDTTEDPQGRQTRNVYNALGQVERVERSDKPVGTSPRNWVIVQRFAYDGLLRLKDSYDAANLKTSFQYNSRDNVTLTTYPDDSVEQNIYRTGNDDILIGVKDRVGRNSWFAYDDLGRTTTLQDASGNYSSMAYDKNGNLKQLTDTNGNITQWNYDALDRAINKRYHDGITESYNYQYRAPNTAPINLTGLLSSTTSTRGKTIYYAYDENGNQTVIHYPNTPDVTTRYNRLNDVERIDDGIGTHLMSYDDYGRLISNNGPLDKDTQTYSYDELQRIQTQTVEWGAFNGVHNQIYTYDALGRLSSLNASSTGTTTYSYDGNTDRLRILTHPNGTKSDLRYDAIGRLQHVFNGANGDPLYNRYSSNYDARDVKINTQSRTGSANPLITNDYSYDALDQLKQERVTGGVAGTPYTTNYDYDAMGNRTQMTHVGTNANGSARNAATASTSNALNQTFNRATTTNGGPSAGGSSENDQLYYDDAGNLAYRVTSQATASGGSTSITTYYTYDDADRLTKIERRGDTGQLLTVSEFVYDYASRRALTREYDFANGGWATGKITRRVFDGMDVIQERDANNYVTAQIVRDGNIGGILSRYTGQGAAFYGYDGNGNVTLLTDASGTDVAHYRYDAFGNTLEAAGPRAAENPYRFSTKELHGPSGLYDYGLRFYSPSMGRWINRDPLSEGGGVNLYAAMGNNAVNSVDEYGLASKNAYYRSRGEAWHATKDRAGIPRSQSPRAQWTVGGDKSRKGMKNYKYSDNKTTWGRYYQYETPQGSRLIVDHTADGQGHLHAGQPKGNPNRRVNMKDQERYGQVGEKNHNYYEEKGSPGYLNSKYVEGLNNAANTLNSIALGISIVDIFVHPDDYDPYTAYWDSSERRWEWGNGIPLPGPLQTGPPKIG